MDGIFLHFLYIYIKNTKKMKQINSLVELMQLLFGVEEHKFFMNVNDNLHHVDRIVIINMTVFALHHAITNELLYYQQ